MPIRIYTRTGDEGGTSLYDGSREPKNSPRVECLGTLDELNCQIGLARCQAPADDHGAQVRAILLQTQRDLFRVQAEIARAEPATAAGHAPIAARDVEALERVIDAWLKKIDDVAAFIVPGTSELAARLHVARTVCRRAERRLVDVHAREPVRAELLQYVNRLSDVLYALARHAEAERIYVNANS